MQSELVQVRDLLAPGVDPLPRFEPARERNTLGASEVANGVGGQHGPHGKWRLHRVSTPRVGTPARLIHNSQMLSASLHPDDAQTFAGRLELAMKRKGVNANQMQVAMAKAGYHLPRQTLGNMLRGRTKRPTWDKLVLISSYLGVRPEWLADGVLPMLPAPMLDDNELQLVLAFRAMSPNHQKDLCDIAERWAESDGDDDPGPSHGTYSPRARKQ